MVLKAYSNDIIFHPIFNYILTASYCYSDYILYWTNNC